VVDDCEYSVKALQLWEIGDQIHGHHLERSRMGVGGDWLKWSFSMCSTRFVLLTYRATSHIFFGKGFHFLPLVSLAKEMYGVCDAQMSGKGMIVIRL
jgi:hypothetical protein